MQFKFARVRKRDVKAEFDLFSNLDLTSYDEFETPIYSNIDIAQNKYNIRLFVKIIIDELINYAAMQIYSLSVQSNASQFDVHSRKSKY